MNVAPGCCILGFNPKHIATSRPPSPNTLYVMGPMGFRDDELTLTLPHTATLLILEHHQQPRESDPSE